MFCTKCGAKLTEGSKYCHNCGASVSGGKSRLAGLFAVVVLAAVLIVGGMLILRQDVSDGSSSGAVVAETAGQELLTALAGDVAQVLPMNSGVVSVLYTDGTVGIAGDDALAAQTASWKDIRQIYEYYEYSDGFICHLAGLRNDGTAVSTKFDLSCWSNLKELHTTWCGIAGLTEDGNVVSAGEWEEGCDPAGMSDMRSLTFWNGICYGIRNDGTVDCAVRYDGDDALTWKNVRELYATTHTMYAILEDGSVVSGLCEDAFGLQGAVKLAAYDDWLFGLSPDGRLLTEQGELYAYCGIFSMDPSIGEYTPEVSVDISRYRNIRDFTFSGALIMLNHDGTVDWVNCSALWDFSSWQNISSVCASEDSDWMPRVYGLREDGTVIVVQDDQDPLELDNYLSWNLAHMIPGKYGVIGITPEGKLVGDGAYASTDFSVLHG